MRAHRNARTTPYGRALLVRRVRQEGRSVAETAHELGVSRQTVYKWLRRFESAGSSALVDQPSRPHRLPGQTPERAVQQIERLRRQRRLTAVEIAAELGLAASTVSRILRRIGLGKLWRVEVVALEPPRRYEHARPGAMVHIDAKKLARIERIGHRIHGDRRLRQRGVGWEWTFVAVDDCTRLAYAEVRAREDATCATSFLRSLIVRFESLGIGIERVLTDNAKCYASKPFRELCQAQGIRQVFTRPYTPRTNGKAERFIQTLTRRWAHRRPYRTSAHRTAALRPWIAHYNHSRPHRALGMRPPMARLRESREQRA
jgi:transposase InsO family protein